MALAQELRARRPEPSGVCAPAGAHRRRVGPICRGLVKYRCMRVIAGEFGGRELVTPRGRATRPTSDRVREALFSILGDVSGARVLDLFAGSGALAIEALSRGAGEATLVDAASAPIQAIRRNLDALGIEA
jgi:16S rRNA (guanine(966)-N(2))-methyltransferase RsmD